MGKRCNEDLAEGELLPCGPVVFTREAIPAFAREVDPQPFHADEEAAARSVFAWLIASSFLKENGT